MLGVIFQSVFFRFLSTRDGFLTLREGEAAHSNSGTCILTLVFMHFDPFITGRKMPFFRALTVLLIIAGALVGVLGGNFG